MKLNKALKNTVLASMTLLAAAAISFTGCSNGSSDDNDGPSSPINYALPTVELKTDYKWDASNNRVGSGESFYDGVLIKLKENKLDPANLTAGTKCTFTLAGDLTKNFTYVNAEESENPKLFLGIVDTCEAANYWKQLGGTSIELDKNATTVDLTWEFNLEAKAATKSKSDITIFIKVDKDPAWNAANSLKITTAGANNGRPAAGTVVCSKAKNLSLPVNNYDGNDHGLQFHDTDNDMFPQGVKAGETYTVSIKGTLSADISNKFCFGFSKAYNWDLADLAVYDPADSNPFTVAKAAAGQTFDITFKVDAEASDIYLWVYTEGAGETSKTLDLSEFKITKKN